MNNDYILVNDLYHLPTALLFDGCSVICDPRSHTDSVIDCLNHGEECTELHPMDCDYNVLQLCFTKLQTNGVMMTLAETMQHACKPLNTTLRKHYKSPDPALNVMKHNELAYMDATWLDAPTVDHEVTDDHDLTGAASVNASVEFFVSIPFPKLKQVSVRPYEEQPKSMLLVCQSLLLTMCESNIFAQDGRLTSDLFKIISLDSSPHEWNHPVSATTSIATPVATSMDTSAHHTMVGNCDPVSSMGAVTWEPTAVQVYEESKDFSIALTLDMDGVSKIGLDIIDADGVVH